MREIGITIAFEPVEEDTQSPEKYGNRMKELLAMVLVENRDEFAGHAKSITIGPAKYPVRVSGGLRVDNT